MRTYLNDVDDIYAYPAYDKMNGGPPESITDADLLAPVLLNARLTIRAFYGLQEKRGMIEEGLRDLPTTLRLVDADSEHLQAVGSLYSVLDRPTISGVQGTILSKVLHRKRPLLIPLYDRNIERCYTRGTDPPLVNSRSTSWQEYMTAHAECVQADLRAGYDTWERLRSLAPREPISQVRALDIVAWRLGSPIRRST